MGGQAGMMKCLAFVNGSKWKTANGPDVGSNGPKPTALGLAYRSHFGEHVRVS